MICSSHNMRYEKHCPKCQLEAFLNSSDDLPAELVKELNDEDYAAAYVHASLEPTDIDAVLATGANTRKALDAAQSRCVAHAITIGRLKSALELTVGMLGKLEESLDAQIYPEQVKDDFDAPDDRIYELTMTAGQWRMLAKAHQQAINALVASKVTV